MASMTTTRNFWVNWTCVFDKQPTVQEIHDQRKRMSNYLKNYLREDAKVEEAISEWDEKKLRWTITGHKKKDPKYGAKWIGWLVDEWAEISNEPLIYNYKAYFRHEGKRYAQTKGTTTPPTPPRPPGP